MKRFPAMRCGVLFALAAGLSACSGGGDAEQVTTTPAPSAAAIARGGEFTAAVPLGSAAAAAKLQFKLGSRPQVGEAVTLELKLTATRPVEELEVTLEPEEGLTLEAGAPGSFAFGETAPDGGHSHEAKLVPVREGVNLLKARVVTRSEGADATTEYAIPLLVVADVAGSSGEAGAAGPEGPAGAPATAPDPAPGPAP